MKNFNRLSLAILILGATLIIFAFIPDIEIWKEFFSHKMENGQHCHHSFNNQDYNWEHYHWNYKGYLWFFTGFALFIVQIARIVFIFKDKDFNK